MSPQSGEPRYVLRFFFDAGSGHCFWPGNKAAESIFGSPVPLEKLPLSIHTRGVLDDLVRLYDQSFNWKSPTDPGPWSAQQEQEFHKIVREALKTTAEELGADFQIVHKYGIDE